MRIQTALIVPDSHVPCHDKLAFKIMFKIAKHIYESKTHDLAEIVFLGDFIENLAVSTHKKDLPYNQSLKHEIDEVNKQLDYIDELFPSEKVKKVFCEGNHEERLSRFIRDKAPELYGLSNIEELLKIKERRYKWVKFEPRQSYSLFNGSVITRHTPVGSSAKTTAMRAGSRVDCILFGHIHSFDEASVGCLGQSAQTHQTVKAKACGFLGDLNDKVFKYSDNNNWALGFMLAHYHSGRVFLEQVEISRDYKAYALAKVFSL